MITKVFLHYPNTYPCQPLTGEGWDGGEVAASESDGRTTPPHPNPLPPGERENEEALPPFPNGCAPGLEFWHTEGYRRKASVAHLRVEPEQGAGIQARDGNGETPLCQAAPEKCRPAMPPPLQEWAGQLPGLSPGGNRGLMPWSPRNRPMAVRPAGENATASPVK